MKKLLMLILALGVSVSAQSHRATQNAAAMDAFKQAEPLRDAEPEKAAALYKKALDSDLDFLPAHEGYVWASKRARQTPLPPPPPPKPDAPKNSKGVTIYFAPKTLANPVGGGAASEELKATYSAWIQQHPDKAILYWGLGYVTLNTDKVTAEASLKKAIALDPKFSPAYRALALLSQISRDNDGRIAWLKRAVEADPLDDDSLLEYVDLMPEADRTAKLWMIADRSPGTNAAYSALLRLSNVAPTPEAKLPVYARMWKTFPEMKTYSHCWSMKTFFNLISGSDPATALAVATRFDDVCGGDPDWPDLLAYQTKFNGALDQMAKKQYAPALALLAAVTPPRSTDGTPYYLARAEAEGAVNPQAAYDRLLPVAAKEPKDPLNKALAGLAATLKKTPTQMDDDLWTALSATAKPFKDFTLTRFDTGQPLTLSSLKGKVVLVNFWFPTCGPCMNEFPYIQQALDKYKTRGFEILAINIVSSEDKDVLQTAKDKKISFITLKMLDKDFASREYKVNQAPVNFLLDRDGRFLYQPAIHDRETARTFELEIELLLSRAKK
ncbi:MAG: redoxin family protein [Acidobacteriota bacterium]